MFSSIIFSNFSFVYSVLALFLSLILGVFFFWRSAKHEFWDSQDIFDLTVVFLAGSLLGGRVLDFFLRYEYFEFSVRKLVFFNAFPGFDYFGAFFGAILAVLLYSLKARKMFWYYFDFLVFGIGFAIFIHNLFLSLFGYFVEDGSVAWQLNTYYALLYFLLFWTLKKLEKKKRHIGFFSCFFIIFISIINLGSIFFRETTILYLAFLTVSFGVLLSFGLVSWYILSKRKARNDLKMFVGFLILLVMKFIRVFTNIREADSVAKSIIFSPLYLFKHLLDLVKYFGREVFASFIDLLKAFGVNR